MDTKAVRTHIYMPQALVAAVDKLVGNRHRSDFVTAAVAEKVRLEKLGRALAATAGMLACEDHPEWDTPEHISEWVHQLRAEDNAIFQRKLAPRDD